MADTAKRLAGPTQPGLAAATVYTTPAGKKTIVRNIHVANGSASAVPLALSLGVDAAGTRLFSALSIPSASSFDWSGFIVLEAGEVLQASVGTAATLVLTISGVEVDV